MASSTLNNLSAKTPATSSIVYVVNSPFGAGDDGKATLKSVTESIGIPRILYKQGLPMINLSSGTATGSPSGTGAFTGITALANSVTPAHAYVYLPAGANVDGASTAGWYYCTFATASTGTIFNNRFDPTASPGTIPTIPASPTATTTLTTWTAGTGTVAAASFVVPANSMGNNGILYFPSLPAEATNNANGKSVSITFGAFNALTTTTGSIASVSHPVFTFQIANDGSVSNQNATGTSGVNGIGMIPQAGTVSTASDVTVTISLTHGTATDNVGLWGFQALLASTGA